MSLIKINFVPKQMKDSRTVPCFLDIFIFHVRQILFAQQKKSMSILTWFIWSILSILA